MRTAAAAFGDPTVFIEKYLENPRHIEVQVFADSQGDVVHMFERDCSIQRRHQKLVEEAPAPFLPEETRQRLQNAAKAIVAKAGYVGIGTVEFLVAEDGTMTFLEVNTRLQVEHGVTEQVYMVDLVLEQFNLAEGGALTIDDDPEPRGHAIEFRLVAEDPGTGFMPSAGQIDWLRLPAGPGVRVDAGIFPGSVVSVYFDSMLAKLVFRGKDREECLQRARRGLKETVISGVSTSLEFDRKILDQPAFCAPNGHLGIYTTWVESEFLPFWKPESSYVSGSEQASLTRFVIEVDGRRVILGLPRMILAGLGNLDEGVEHLELVDQSPALVHAPIAGTIGRLDVSEGDHVEAGQEIAIIEALKMGLSVYAPRAGVVGPWKVAVGTRVEADDELVMIA
jgi:acetyl-CoA/propionyl-CoA carboxylase biotin carboxyl carrier protein